MGYLRVVAEVLHLGIHHALGHMVLAEGLGELLPRDVSRVRVGLTNVVPPCMCGARVGGDTNTLLIGASG